MKSKASLILPLAVAGTIAGIYIAGQPSSEKAAPAVATARARIEMQPAGLPPQVTAAPTPEFSAAKKNTEAAAAPATVDAQSKSQARRTTKFTTPKESVQDPVARVALSLVGADPVAEAYWLGAISDPTLPDQEREDLMEDLNEDGLSDPKHPGPEDLPLIVNSIRIIEEIAPYGDAFMQEHLGEAYKDLNNLLAGRPVQ